MERRLAFAWLGGYLEVYLDDGLTVEASNSTIVFKQREVEVSGLYYTYREYFLSRRRERKAVYVDLAFPLKGKSGETPQAIVLSNGDFSIGPFGLSYTVLDGVDYYLTVHSPPGFLYDHAVVSTRNVYLAMSGRRQVYLMDEGRVKRLILV